MWNVEVTDAFATWFASLDRDAAARVAAAMDVLADRGPVLGRPLVDRINGSRHGPGGG